MTKTYYFFGYSETTLQWKEVFTRAASIIVYNDAVIDRVLDESLVTDNADSTQSENRPTDSHSTESTDNHQRYYIITNEKIINSFIKYTSDYVSLQDIENIILSNKAVYIKGFLFIRRRKSLINQMVNSACDNDFNETSTKLGLDTWKYEFYHKKFLFNKMNRLVNKTTLKTLYEIKRNHPLIYFFQDFLRSCFKVINKRVFSIIIIGNTKIGKSICFKECLIDNRYIEYHNNMLEFSKCTDENKKLFRLLDDINWNTVDVMTLKSILNRNVSSVDVKYSYGIIYPMINIFLMNKEDYAIFQRKYVDIWSFISNNVSIYPRQLEKEITEETVQLYDTNNTFTVPLFNDIMDITQHEAEFDNQIRCGTFPNIYECVKSYLVNDKPYIYDNRQFLDISSIDISLLPNRQLIVNEMTQKIKEVETEEKYKQKVQSKEHSESSDSESEEKDIDPQYNKKGCLDYYFKKHTKNRNRNKVHKKRREYVPKTTHKKRDNPYMNDFIGMEEDNDTITENEMDNDNDIGDDMDNDNDMDDMDNDYSDDIMDESFNV